MIKPSNNSFDKFNNTILSYLILEQSLLSALLITLFTVVIIKFFKTDQRVNDTIFEPWKAVFIINILSKAAESVNNKLLD